MNYKEHIDIKKLPRHVAIIMDGNGRWAKKKGGIRIFGHQNGVKAVTDVVEASAELGIKYLTLYAFSTENWNRPKVEVDALMGLLISTIHKELNTLTKNNIRLLAIGNILQLPNNVRKELQKTIDITSKNTGLTLVLALSYSSRWEINNAVKNIAKDVKNNILNPDEIDEITFNKYLTTSEIPDPELLIRTSGEYRISNFLLYQLAYTELYFTDTLWPDFTKEDFYKAINDYQKRERRFGLISEQIKNQQ
ncbi:MAG: di-trans,poly-cis-decaprenylcistransferase [Bacteroidetes bacterium GWA2_32_17]|nr:MAG: di-trans,poly-cis-decaprenylcistransferase [Bacteroidetes bacterium GWA2_32_17]